MTTPQVVATLNKADEEHLRRFILKLSDGLSSRSLRQFVYTSARPHLQMRIAQRFETQGDDASGPWAPLSSTTVRIREWQARKYGLPIRGDEPINRRTSDLKQYVTRMYEIDEGWRQVELIIPGRRGSGNVYLDRKLLHAQKGGSGRLPGGGTTSFPARPVLAMNDQDKSRLEERFGHWVQGMLRTIL